MSTTPMTSAALAAELAAGIAAELGNCPLFQSCMTQLRKIEAQARRDAVAAQIAAQQKKDAAMAEAAKQGVTLGAFRVRELSKQDGGGFNVEQFGERADRTIGWTKLNWHRTKDAAEAVAAKYRKFAK